MMTSHDMRDQIRTAVNASDGEYDIDAILTALQDTYGTTDINDIDPTAFWAVVGAHVKA